MWSSQACRKVAFSQERNGPGEMRQNGESSNDEGDGPQVLLPCLLRERIKFASSRKKVATGKFECQVSLLRILQTVTHRFQQWMLIDKIALPSSDCAFLGRLDFFFQEQNRLRLHVIEIFVLFVNSMERVDQVLARLSHSHCLK